MGDSAGGSDEPDDVAASTAGASSADVHFMGHDSRSLELMPDWVQEAIPFVHTKKAALDRWVHGHTSTVAWQARLAAWLAAWLPAWLAAWLAA